MVYLVKQDYELRMDRFKSKIMVIRFMYLDMMKDNMMSIDVYHKNLEKIKRRMVRSILRTRLRITKIELIKEVEVNSDLELLLTSFIVKLKEIDEKKLS